MLRNQDAIDLTRVGPGTVMGDYMRQFWIPCAKSSEVTADGAPMRLPILGEKLIAFRDSSGRVGIMDHRCPHRCASLFLGRNEESGLRCVYHGWKFDADGNCVDMPSVPEGETIKDRIKAKAYKTAERNGLIWVYMGVNQASPPALPDIEPNMLPVSEVDITFVHRDCNWLQAIEGDIDTSHFGFLHMGAIGADEVDEDHRNFAPLYDRAPKYEVEDTQVGTSYGAYRPLPNGTMYWRTSHFLLPFWSQNPAGPIATNILARAWVPIDDERSMLVYLQWRNVIGNAMAYRAKPLKSGRVLGPGYQLNDNFLPNTTDWYGRWRLAENEANDWKIDREAQRTGVSYTGIENITLQDQAITESMGPIVDHDFEHLMVSDVMISRTRRRLLREARRYAETKQTPEQALNPQWYGEPRGGFYYSDKKLSWKQAHEEAIVDLHRPGSKAVAAE